MQQPARTDPSMIIILARATVRANHHGRGQHSHELLTYQTEPDARISPCKNYYRQAAKHSMNEN